ncbi:MAG TPA: hypothetical protein VLF43_03650 [Candidatus Saccharimonadales bacterium]|nr:hypothetical protein [Candidatus Saccharimonadales bacterium]
MSVEAPLAPPPIAPQPPEAAAENSMGFTGYWTGEGTPSAAEVTKLRQTEKVLSRGPYGRHLKNVAEVGTVDDSDVDVQIYGTNVYAEEQGLPLTNSLAVAAYRVRETPEADREAEKEEAINDILNDLHMPQALSDPKRRDSIKASIAKDVEWAASLPVNEKHEDPLITLQNDIDEFRDVQNLRIASEEAYAAGHGKAYKRAVKVGRFVKAATLAPANASTWALSHAAARIASNQAQDPERTARVRKGLQIGQLALMAVGIASRVRTGVAADGGFFDAALGNVDEAVAHAYHAINPFDGQPASAASSGFVGHHENAQTPKPPQSHKLPDVDVSIGEYQKDKQTGTYKGTVWYQVDHYARENGIKDNLTDTEFNKAVDNILKHNHVGGEGASHHERWKAAGHMSAKDKLHISGADFKGLVPDDAGVSTPTGHNNGGHLGHHKAAPHGATAPNPDNGDRGADGLPPHDAHDINPNTNGHTGKHTPALEHARPAAAVPIIGGTPDDIKHAAANAGIGTGLIGLGLAGAYSLNRVLDKRKKRPKLNKNGSIEGEFIDEGEDENETTTADPAEEAVLLASDDAVNNDIRYLVSKNVPAHEINRMNDTEVREAARILREG